MIQVNQTTIAEQQILTEMQYHPASSQREAMIQAAESLVIAELLRQRAQELGLTLSDDDAAATDNDYLEALITKEVAMPQASEDECRVYFQNNQQRFSSSPILEVQHILLAADPKDEEARIEAKLEAEKVLIKLHTGGNFETLAAEFSGCPSKNEGGDLGQISRGQTVPEFERQLLLAKVGLLAKPLETRYGYHVVKVNRYTQGQQLKFEDVQEKIANYLNDRVRNKAIAQYIQNLIADAEIEGYDFSLSASPLVQ